jgi:23S rRNA (cytosine1962-C5)-methyltransferase
MNESANSTPSPQGAGLSMQHARRIILKKKEERRIVAGHPWVFSNEIAEVRGEPSIGDVVEVRTAGGTLLGVGFFNPHSLIAVRMLSASSEEIDEHFFTQRIAAARALRSIVYSSDQALRLIHGEADFLPGLVVDKYNEYLVLQTFSYGMDARLQIICNVLESLLSPAGIVERNESPLRLLEGLPLKRGILRGEAPPTVIQEHGLQYTVDLLGGQKTGLFLDQKENRLAIRRFSPGARVLDCFCNDGGFSLNAARGGAASVLGIDSSEEAIRNAERNASSNDIDVARFIVRDVFEELQALHGSGQTFDLVVLDPPSFTRSRKNVPTAKRGYRELNAKALRVLKQGGILFTASCSHHIEPDVFLELIHDAARHSGRHLQLLEWRGASPDHPTHPGVPETRYLKLGILRAV